MTQPRLALAALVLSVIGAATVPATRTVALPQASPGDGGLVAVNGTELYVHRRGQGIGPAIVVVHGGPVLEHGYLVPWLAPLADEYQLVFYDQRISGRSAGSTEPEAVRVATFVEDIEALRQQLDLGEIHLMGHSWGGHLALQYAIRHGSDLRSLTLIGPMAPSAAVWQQEEAELGQRLSEADRAELQALRSADGVASGSPAALQALLLASFRTQFHDRSKADLLDLFVPDDYLSRSRQFGAMMVDLTDFDLEPELDSIAVPTLLLYGADEPGLEFGGHALQQGIPGARLEVIEAAGHFPFIEQSEAFLAAVREFLAAVSD